MTVQTAQRVPFRPAQCPGCLNFVEEIHRCRAYITPSFPRPLLGAFSGESDQPCPRFEAQAQSLAVTPPFDTSLERPDTSGEQAVEDASKPLKIIASAISDPAMPTSTSLQKENPAVVAPVPARAASAQARIDQETIVRKAHIHCPRCKSVNLSTAWRCQNCDANLLPAESFAERVALFIGFLAGAAILLYLFYRFNIQDPGTAPNFVLCNPGALVGGGILSFIMAFVRLLRVTPAYVKYQNRAERHLNLNAWQALDDLNHAMDLASEKEQGNLIKQRAKVYEKLGLTDEAARDHLTLATSPNSYKGEGEWISAITGADADVFSSGMRSGKIKAMLASGNVKAVGFCRRCKAVVELNPDQRCPSHPKVKGAEVQFVIPADVLAGKLAVMQKLEHRYYNISKEITALLESKEAKAIGYCRRCKAAVELNAQRRCSIHPKVKGRMVQYAVPGDEPAARRVILRWRRVQKAAGRQKSVAVLALIVIVVVVLLYVFQMEITDLMLSLRNMLR
ncbi:MAG: hypothetical protein A2136_05260 [Chloroflexi bacterium RBG_16_54_11]|nr:MAG: hypothetical protein A2136_05260 [Chloroflexi bacterium RBG_16_54_11]